MLGRFSSALDVANAVLYLASDEAAFISDVCLEVDGARCVWTKGVFLDLRHPYHAPLPGAKPAAQSLSGPMG